MQIELYAQISHLKHQELGLVTLLSNVSTWLLGSYKCNSVLE